MTVYLIMITMFLYSLGFLIQTKKDTVNKYNSNGLFMKQN